MIGMALHSYGAIVRCDLSSTEMVRCVNDLHWPRIGSSWSRMPWIDSSTHRRSSSVYSERGV